MPAHRFAVPLLAVAVLATVVGSSTVAGSARPAAAAPGDPPPEAGVSVEGVGTATATPDVLRFTVGVESQGGSVGDALAGANSAAQRILEVLRERDVAERDVQTASVQIYPSYDRNGEEITGYVARHDLTVTLRDLGSAGETIGAAVEAGGDAARLQGLSYALDDDTAVQAEARDEAFAAARRKAEQYAELTGRSLGGVLEVRERVGSTGPGPVMAMDSGGAEAAAVPIAPGSAEVAVTVEVRWALT